MKVEMKELQKYGRELQFGIEKEEVNAERKKIISEIRNTTEIPGFRKGKAPEDIIEGRFGSAINEKVIRNLITSSYLKTITEQNIHPVIEPEISDVKLDESLTFKVYIEVKPDVTVKKYKGLVVKKVAPEPVTDEAVEEMLRQYEKQKEFAASVIDPEKRRAWHEKIRKHLEQINAQEARRAEENQIWKQLYEQSEVIIPDKLMEQRARQMTREQLNYMNLEGKSEEEIEKLVKDMFEKIKPVAQEQLRKFFILERIAELEKIEPTQQEIEESIERIARTSGETPAQVRKRLTESDRMDEWISDMRLNKTFKFLIDNAQVIERVVLPGEKHESRKTR